MPLLIDILEHEKVLTEEQVCFLEEKSTHESLSLRDLAIRENLISEQNLLSILSKHLDIPLFSLNNDVIDPSAMKAIPQKIAKRYGVFPVSIDDNSLRVATSDPFDVVALDDIRFITDMKVKPVLSEKNEIERHIDVVYRQAQDSISELDLLENMEYKAEVEKLDDKEIEGECDLTMEELSLKDSSVVKLSNGILNDAIKARATDIHIEPCDTYVDVRYRIDGVLRSVIKISQAFRCSLAARLKVLTNLDISETRKPQDGRARIKINGWKLDMRISTIPVIHGEKVVMRLLPAHESIMALETLGFTASEMNAFTDAINQPQGIILITGPTGAGKTTTLYAALNQIKKTGDKNIVTIEDPIEYLMQGINQMQVNLAKNVTFANGLRSILRQDPNVILVGEIRDGETAEIAFRASLTGHLVLSTLHTNSSVSTVTRLVNIGLEPYLIASSLSLVIAQRLVRLTCSYCKEKYNPDPRLIFKFKKYISKFNLKKFYRGKGCSKCSFSGFLGRAAIYEILKIDTEIRTLIENNARVEVIYAAAIKSGMRPLIESGMAKVALGFTTLEEVARIADIIEFCETLKTPETAAVCKEALEEERALNNIITNKWGHALDRAGVKR